MSSKLTKSTNSNPLRTTNHEPRRAGTSLRSGCEDCEHSRSLNGLGAAVLICSRKKGARRQWQAVAADDWCDNFKRAREILPPDLAEALAEGAKLIPLTQGKFAIVDAADYEWLNQYKWHVKKHKHTSYARTQKNGKSIRMHRLITSAPPHLFVDHRDLNGLNNRRSNLRLCTRAENIHNQGPRKGGTSKYKGVYLKKLVRKFVAQISINGKKPTIGCFDNEIEAAVAYDIKAMELFGEFAYLNFPDLMQRYRRQMTEVRRQKSEERRQMTEDPGASRDIPDE